jgi:hypothetical protein
MPCGPHTLTFIPLFLFSKYENYLNDIHDPLVVILMLSSYLMMGAVLAYKSCYAGGLQGQSAAGSIGQHKKVLFLVA